MVLGAFVEALERASPGERDRRAGDRRRGTRRAGCRDRVLRERFDLGDLERRARELEAEYEANQAHEARELAQRTADETVTVLEEHFRWEAGQPCRLHKPVTFKLCPGNAAMLRQLIQAGAEVLAKPV